MKLKKLFKAGQRAPELKENQEIEERPYTMTEAEILELLPAVKALGLKSHRKPELINLMRCSDEQIKWLLKNEYLHEFRPSKMVSIGWKSKKLIKENLPQELKHFILNLLLDNYEPLARHRKSSAGNEYLSSTEDTLLNYFVNSARKIGGYKLTTWADYDKLIFYANCMQLIELRDNTGTYTQRGIQRLISITDKCAAYFAKNLPYEKRSMHLPVEFHLDEQQKEELAALKARLAKAQAEKIAKTKTIE